MANRKVLHNLPDTDKLTTDNMTDEDFSLESILAEYSDFDLEKAAERETEARSKQIIYEALGETEFSGGLTSDEAADGADECGEGCAAGPDTDPYRVATRYTHRLRRSFERIGRRRREDAAGEAVVTPAAEEPEPWAEPYEPGAEQEPYEPGAGTEPPEADAWPEPGDDDDVKVYRPAKEFSPPEGDEDVKLYGGLDGVVAEAERRSSAWSSGFAGLDEADYVPDNDTDAFSGDTVSYGFTGSEGEEYAAPGSENAPRDYGSPRRAGAVLGFLASLGERLGRAKTAGEAVMEEDSGELSEEVPPKKAARYYAGAANSLKLRTRLAIFPLAALLWVSLGLPAFGALGSDLKVTSLACLVMQLTVCMIGLDIFTCGLTSLVRGQPSLWSLVSVANIAAALDAAVAYAAGTAGWGYPMCAAAALAMFFALWGALLEARALRFSSKARELAEDPMSVTAERGIEGREGTVLLKSHRSIENWLRRCEEPDEAENIFYGLAPWLLLAAFALSAAAAAISGQWTYFFRIFAAATCAIAPAGAFIACPLPYFLLALRSFARGAAVAGWPGMRDIGRSLGMVITDSDLFPDGCVKISSIRILDGASPEDIISDAGSVIIASGSGLSPVFAELMRRNSCAMRRVEDFCCHEGGGLTALIAGREVLCGSAGFMRLMGILVPQKLADKSAVFISVSGVLSGIFKIEYTASPSVGKALAGCLKSRRAPIFAVRDFLVTPMLLHRRYRVPAESFDFPLFSVRYAVSATEPDENSTVCALLGREGLGGFMEVSSCGRRCYLAGMLGSALSAVSAVVNLALAFALFAFGGGLSAAWLIGLACLWLLPGLAASIIGSR